MNYKIQLTFLINTLKNLHLQAALFQPPFKDTEDFDFGIRKIAFPNLDYQTYTGNFFKTCQSNTIYRSFDEFLFNYIILVLPNTAIPSYLVIGPYTLTNWSNQTFLNIAEEFCIPAERYQDFCNCCKRVPFLTESGTFFTLINTFAETIWGSMDAFSMIEINTLGTFDQFIDTNIQKNNSDELFTSMKHVELKYTTENELIQAVSHGQLHKIEMYIDQINFHNAEQRLADPIRNAKNYAIIMNTLLRKAAESGAVHPMHIDSISSSFAKKIEVQTCVHVVSMLLKEMARKYTLLVKNHSLKGYSTLVRRVLVHIDTDLSADLSLNTQAALLNINPSYLSQIFKKETGHTLTEYVTGKRIEHAVFLLNSTNMQIQRIAEYCGIPDICYFTKVFKKRIGKTPTEYRNSIKK